MKIAISGLGSAGATSTAKAVSEKLNISLNSYTLRNLAQDLGLDIDYVHSQAKKNDPSIDRMMDTQQIDFLLKHTDGVVASDLACWLDDTRIYKTLGLHKPEIDLKIWLDPTYESRAKRFEGRHDKTTGRGLAQYDQEVIDHYKEIYGIDITDHQAIDWIFDTSNLTIEAVVEAIAERVAKH